jgi:hypothetical protein
MSGRIIPAADDVEFIAKRLKELEAEKAKSPADDLPSDVEPLTIGLDEWWLMTKRIGMVDA